MIVEGKKISGLKIRVVILTQSWHQIVIFMNHAQNMIDHIFDINDKKNWDNTKQ